MTKPYSIDPTSNADIQSELMRIWYEKNRESWWDRFCRRTDVADEFMLSMLAYARRVDNCEIPLPDSMTGDD